MNQTNNGGAAFPQRAYEAWGGGEIDGSPGMTLRDYFAAKALAAMIGFGEKDCGNRGSKGVPTLAKFAYEYADAMLAERAK